MAGAVCSLQATVPGAMSRGTLDKASCRREFRTSIFVARVIWPKLLAACPMAPASARRTSNVFFLKAIKQKSSIMQIQTSCELIYAAIGVIGLLFLIGLCIEAVVLFPYSLQFMLNLLKWSLLWATGAKAFEELRTRLDAHHAEWVKERIARGQPVTLGGILKFLGRRIWTANRHPIRVWRSEFDLPKKQSRDPSGDKP
jgi:hypothetical protein